MFATVLSPLYDAVAWIINTIHSGHFPHHVRGLDVGPVHRPADDPHAPAAVPLFVKQIKSQREMQLLQPKIAALKELYPGDKQRQSQEQMAIFKEHGVNPFSGCLPLLVQLPVFFALFGVLHKFTPDKHGVYKGYAHLSAATVKAVATSKTFGVPMAAAFSSSKTKLDSLHVSSSTVKTVTIIMIVLMMLTSLLTSRQMLARNAGTGGAQEGSQKALIYGIPLIFGVIGVNFQMGVLLYWLTTNVWTYFQQAYVLKNMSDNPEQVVT